MANKNVVLVCGSHTECDEELIYKVLDDLHRLRPINLLVQGFAKNTDQIAHAWARKRGVNSTGDKYKITNTDWHKLGKGAGPWRNKNMLVNERPNTIVAFPGGNGTANMIEQGRKAYVSIIEVDKDGGLHESYREPFFRS